MATLDGALFALGFLILGIGICLYFGNPAGLMVVGLGFIILTLLNRFCPQNTDKEKHNDD